MPYKCEEILREKAEAFITVLLDAGVPVAPHPTMFRDYMVKLAVEGSGAINIYYSPKRDIFSLKLHELNDASLVEEVEACWNGEPSEPKIQAEPCEYQAYVDGSHIDDFVGLGAVILHHGQEVARYSEAVTSHTDMNQVAGELGAVKCVIAWCRQNHVSEIEIFYDYAGIEKWATGEWRAKKHATQDYVKFVQESAVQVTWRKVRSHTGIRWNDVADELAKQGALSQHEAGDVTEDPSVEVAQVAASFVDYLVGHNIDASFDKVYNDQFARIIIENGYFDLYNTRKHRLSPRIHNFKDDDLQAEVERAWRKFSIGEQDDGLESEITGFEEVEYYLAIFEPYRHLNFDFSALANALQPFVESNSPLPICDYNELKQLYDKVRSMQ